ncbi:hypothetical protein AGMMS49587_09580 [Spirochaetia bacterium]|nr:hypothetical protein AGMMS49587_09580 [Spirochaetia bacterium]
MNKKSIFSAMLVGLLALSFVFVSCKTDDGGGGGGGNTIIITNISTAQFLQGSVWSHLGVFPVGTTKEEALAQTGVVAGSQSDNPYDGVENDILGSKVTYPLWTLSSTSWTGAGTYDVYLALYNGATTTVYKKGSVEINAGTTTFSAATFVLAP